jgi:F-type H+-transporting ATPase subunit a
MNRITTRFSTRNTLIFALFTLVFLLSKSGAIAQNHEKHGHETVTQQVEKAESVAIQEGIIAAETITGKHETKEEKFNTSKIIMEHIADAHDWHLWGHTSIHLPVILYTDKGIEMFSSGNFNHGHDAYKGKLYTYQIIESKVKIVKAAEAHEATPAVVMDEHHNVAEAHEATDAHAATAEAHDGHPAPIIDEAATSHLIDFSITKNVASMMVSMLFLFLIFFSVAAAYKKRGINAPKGLQSWIEPLIVFVRDEIARPNLGEKYQKFMPYLLTVFFFIWMNNMLGLVPFFPGGANVTGNIAVTLVLAVITFIITTINGTKTYWSHVFTPHVPLWLYPLMVPVEIIGLFTKPFALMIRLFANITAGHILVLSLVCLIFIFKSLPVAGVSVPFVVFISVIEMLVAFIQAFIFTILSALYIGMALEKPS